VVSVIGTGLQGYRGAGGSPAVPLSSCRANSRGRSARVVCGAVGATSS